MSYVQNPLVWLSVRSIMQLINTVFVSMYVIGEKLCRLFIYAYMWHVIILL